MLLRRLPLFLPQSSGCLPQACDDLLGRANASYGWPPRHLLSIAQRTELLSRAARRAAIAWPLGFFALQMGDSSYKH